jgi:hypothetical protein
MLPHLLSPGRVFPLLVEDTGDSEDTEDSEDMEMEAMVPGGERRKVVFLLAALAETSVLGDAATPIPLSIGASLAVVAAALAAAAVILVLLARTVPAVLAVGAAAAAKNTGRVVLAVGLVREGRVAAGRDSLVAGDRYLIKEEEEEEGSAGRFSTIGAC